jgi:hypothetical protein
MKSQNGMFWVVHGRVLGHSGRLLLCCIALHDCSEVTHGHHRSRSWGFCFCFGLWWWAKEEEEEDDNNMGRNNDGKGDVIALFDVDGTLTYPRLVNSVFFAASFLFLVFFFFPLLLLLLSPRLHLASTVLCERSWNCVVWQ